MKYIHEFQNNTEFENYYFGQNYIEPHVSLTVDVNRLDYNKSGNKDYEYWKTQPLTFQIISLTASSPRINWWARNESTKQTIEYRINTGEWISLQASSTYANNGPIVKRGDIVQFRGNNDISGNYFAKSNMKFAVCGNIMSLVDSINFKNVNSVSANAFDRLFENNTGLTDASNLVLPATILANACYTDMFSGCTSLSSGPILPAISLVPYCYYNMFRNCKSLTTAPALPATTLAKQCYYNMFYGCTSLTTAPELPAITLAEQCYSSMFDYCTNLNYVKCLATDISANQCTLYWLAHTSSTGTFVKNPAMTSWTTGASGIPSGWTVQDITNE